MTDQVRVSQEVAAPPERVWAMVSDLPRMGEWSPENTGGRWLGGADGPEVGARFKGTNRMGWRRWSTVCTVTDCAPGQVFAFDADAMGQPIAEWRYEIESTTTGCRVTETWTDRRSSLGKILGRAATAIGDRAEHNRKGMEETLRRLAERAEAASDLHG
jgi:uncharacterized protein YndB with AHSA1/START domain